MNNPLGNRLLKRLTPSDFNLVKPILQYLSLPRRKTLERPHRKISSVYFLTSGIASVVATGTNRASVEVGIIGREGMTGLAVLMGVERSPHHTYMQVSGDGFVAELDDFEPLLAKSVTLHRAFLQFGYAFVVQTAQTALANGRSKIEDRLARWLLMAHDRIDGDIVDLTHEFLSIMLGVHRPGVTLAINALAARGAIDKAGRGKLAIRSRRILEDCANGTYGIAEAQLKDLFDR